MKMYNSSLKTKFSIGMVAVLCLVLLPFLSSAQDSNLGNWMIYIGNKKINPKWSIHHEVQYRNYNAVGDLEQLLLRTGLGYNLTDKSNLLLGYGFIHSQNYVGTSDDKVNVDEHRVFQQFISKSKVGIVGLQHRYRFEQRWANDNFRVRFRYFLGLSLPINFKEGSKTYFSAYNEIFLNERPGVFDRNRTYFGLGHKINDKVKVEVGYMNQFFEVDSRDQFNLIVFGNF